MTFRSGALADLVRPGSRVAVGDGIGMPRGILPELAAVARAVGAVYVNWVRNTPLTLLMVFSILGMTFILGLTLSDDLARNAICRGADVALFGHTHCPDLVQLDKVTLFNPGSAAIPRSGRPTYGRITVEEGKAPVFEHLEMPDYE